jgi:hypothetical protein
VSIDGVVIVNSHVGYADCTGPIAAEMVLGHLCSLEASEVRFDNILYDSR